MTDVIVIAGIAGVLVLFAIWGVITYRALKKRQTEVDAVSDRLYNALTERFTVLSAIEKYVSKKHPGQKEFLDLIHSTQNNFSKAYKKRSPIRGADAEQALQKQIIPKFAKVLVNNDPTFLKNTANGQKLQKLIPSTQKKMQAAAREYNNTSLEFNNRIGMTPTNLIAKISKITPSKQFLPRNEDASNGNDLDLN